MLMEPRKTVVKVLGNEVARSYQTLSAAERTQKVSPWPNPTGGWNNTTNLTTITRYYVGGDWDGRVKEIVHPDGTLTTYAYTATAGGGGIVTNRTGQASGSAFYNGTRTITVLGAVGELLSRTTQVLSNSIPTALLVDDFYTYTDDLNRSYTLVSLGNRTNEVQYACCGLDTEIDWEGTPTSYEYDALGRRQGRRI